MSATSVQHSSDPRWPQRVMMTADAVGGVWQYALDLAGGLSSQGTEVLLAVMGDPPGPDQWAASEAVPGLRLAVAPYRLEWMPQSKADVDAASIWLLALARCFKPDVVHLNGYAHAVLRWERPVVVAAHSCVVTWWRAVHGEDPPVEWDAYASRVAAGVAAADVVLSPTRAFLGMLEAAHGALPAPMVVANGRSWSGQPPTAVKEPLILSAGRLWDEAKNVRVLAEAATSLPWPVYAAGADRGPCGAASEVTGVRRIGKISASEMRQWMGRAAIFASPVLYEPFGLAVLEAAQSGCVLVLSDIRTLRELWHRAAMFVPPREPALLAEALRTLISDPARRAALGRAAVERAKSYDVASMTSGTLEAYQRAAVRWRYSRSGSRPRGQLASPSAFGAAS